MASRSTPGGRRIVVSLKTIPSRIRYIEPTLTSLLAQQTLEGGRFYHLGASGLLQRGKMNRQVLQAVVALQRRLGIWSGHAFVDYLALDDYWKDLLDCEAGHALQCERAAAVDSEIMMTQKLATWLLDKKFVLPPPP
mmetsp:Transcript_8645/g.17697  ORF Transcript_8645/g.17697 Transcript_8645/m.17697 type:complete len:137 (+) Transcript_8645:304-714(+)